MNGKAESKLIVAFLARGMAHEVVRSLHERLGLDAFHYGHGRGAGVLHAMTGSEMVVDGGSTAQ